MAAVTVIGIDGGGTATRAVVLDGRGRELVRGTAGPTLTGRPGDPVDIDALVAAVEAAARATGTELPAAALCAGLAGVGRERERAAVESALAARDLAAGVHVVTDVEAAFFDAFSQGPGILVMAGTGSIGFGRAEDGREARVGGWGSIIGDEGGGYDIGRQALRAAARAADGRGPPTELLARITAALGIGEPQGLIAWAASAAKAEIAALAPTVCELAAAGDPVARPIVDVAVAALTSHATALLARLGPWRAPPAAALGGGLLGQAGPLRASLLTELANHPCVPRTSTYVDPARGAAGLALRRL